MSAAGLGVEPVSVREVRLTTPRLILREHRPDDADAVLAYAADRETLRYRVGEPATLDEVRENLCCIDAQRMQSPRRLRYELALVRRADDQLIGWLPLLLSEDRARADAEVGWTLARAYWGQGFATEAARAALQFAFETLGLRRVWARCIADNRASLRVLEKLEMRQEAHFRENEWLKGRYVDTFFYALLDREYWALRREPLQGSPPDD